MRRSSSHHRRDSRRYNERKRERSTGKDRIRSRSRKSSSSIKKYNLMKKKMKHKRVKSNGLEEKTPFYIKNMKFLTPKPRMEVSTKFYRSRISDSSLFKYARTLLELKHNKQMHTGVTLGIPIDLVGSMKNLKKKNSQFQLSDSDLTLLGQIKKDKGKKKYDTTHTWLRKTEYITSHKQNELVDPQTGLFRPTKEKEFNIENSFDQIKNINPKKKNVTVEGIYDVIPDFNLWENKYVNVQFEKFQPKQFSLENDVSFNDGILKRENVNTKDLFYYEQNLDEENSDERFGFKKKYSVEKYNENAYFFTFDEKKKKVLYNPLSQSLILKSNPYRGHKVAPILNVKSRERNDRELKEINKRMLQLGMAPDLDVEEVKK